jgi:hypothetical protein
MNRIAVSTALVLALLTVATVAQGELTQKGNLRVTFDGRVFPRVLPRDRAAPIAVRIEGAVGTVDGTRPPALREISVAVNRAGLVYVSGLATCSAAELQQTTTEAALDICRPALVGHGGFSANVDFPGAPQIPAHGKVLAFNSTYRGHPQMLLHLYGSSPVRATFVLPFRISHRSQGKFGAVFSTRIPNLASDLGYVTDLDLTLGRKYRYAGKRRSFLSASCAAPAGFPGAVFQLARATFTFADGRSLATGITRDCKVR